MRLTSLAAWVLPATSAVCMCAANAFCEPDSRFDAEAREDNAKKKQENAAVETARKLVSEVEISEPNDDQWKEDC